MRTKKLVKLTAALLLATFALTPIIKASGQTKDEGLGGDYHYNAIILEDYNAKDADCEGNAIIGGNLNITGYHDFGTPVVGEPADKNGPTLVVGGDIVNKSPTNVNGDIVVSSEENKGKLPSWMHEKVTIKDKNVIKEHIEGIKDNFINMVEGRIKGNETQVITLNKAKFESMEVNNLVTSNGKKAIVFVNDGSNFEFPNGEPMLNNGSPMDWGKDYKYWSSKIIWYFPNATEIRISEQVVGSVIAPNAVINTHSGNVNGHLLAKTLNQQGGFECHNNVFNPDEVIPPTNEVEDPLGNVKLKKVDSDDNKKVLEGAKFQLLDSNKIPISEHVTDKNGIIEIKDLKPGDYYFKEIAPPDGYKLDESLHEFTIGTDGEDIYVEMTIENEKEKAPDPTPDPEPEKKYGSIELIKVDSSDNEKVLEGAKFHLLDGNKKFISEHVTDKDGRIKIENLEAGEYYFVEIEAPEGYKLDKTLHKFTIGTDGENLNIKITIENEKEPSPTPTPDPEPTPDPKPDPTPEPTPDPTPDPELDKKPDTEVKPEKDKEETSKNETIKVPATGYKGYIGLSALLLGVGALMIFRKEK